MKKLLLFLVALFAISPLMKAEEKTVTIDFSTNAYDLPTAEGNASTKYTKTVVDGDGLKFSINEKLFYSTKNSGLYFGSAKGRFTVAAPEGCEITSVNFYDANGSLRNTAMREVDAAGNMTALEETGWAGKQASVTFNIKFGYDYTCDKVVITMTGTPTGTPEDPETKVMPTIEYLNDLHLYAEVTIDKDATLALVEAVDAEGNAVAGTWAITSDNAAVTVNAETATVTGVSAINYATIKITGFTPADTEKYETPVLDNDIVIYVIVKEETTVEPDPVDPTPGEGTTVTLDFATNAYGLPEAEGDATTVTTKTATDGVTFSVNGKFFYSTKNSGLYFGSSSGRFTVTAPEGCEITSVNFYDANGTQRNTSMREVNAAGEMTALTETGWAGKQAAVTFNIKFGSDYTCDKVVVTYTGTPSENPEPGDTKVKTTFELLNDLYSFITISLNEGSSMTLAEVVDAEGNAVAGTWDITSDDAAVTVNTETATITAVSATTFDATVTINGFTPADTEKYETPDVDGPIYIYVTVKDVNTGVDEINADVNAVYYDLKGNRLECAPEKGLYIRVSNGNATKMLK